MSEEMQEIQRSLGRIEGTQKQILAELENVRRDLNDHKGDDRNNFQAISSRIGTVAKDAEDHLKAQDEQFTLQITELKSNQDKAQGAGWAIIGLMGGVATFIGIAVTAVIEGHIKWHS